jgi:hypothetical protein
MYSPPKRATTPCRNQQPACRKPSVKPPKPTSKTRSHSPIFRSYSSPAPETMNTTPQTQTHSSLDVPSQLQELIAIASQHPLALDETGKILPNQSSSKIRQKALTEIIRLVTPRLWKENVPYYNDALQQTLYYLVRKYDKYDPDRAGVITWLNMRLKFELLNCKMKLAEEQRRFSSLTNAEGHEIDISAPTEFEESGIIDNIRLWVESDPSGELQAEHLRDRPEITSQKIILDRLFKNHSWQILAECYNSSIPTLSSHYQRKCIPRLRAFCLAQNGQ